MGNVIALQITGWDLMDASSALHDRLFYALFTRLGSFTIEEVGRWAPTDQAEVYGAVQRNLRFQTCIVRTHVRRPAQRLTVWVVKRPRGVWQYDLPSEWGIVAVIEPNGEITLMQRDDHERWLAQARWTLTRLLAQSRILGGESA